MLVVIHDFETCYRACQSRDGRFDGWFYVAVTSTGIYCRPSCPAATPKRSNVIYYPTAAAAQGAGFRACKRCRPEAAPGSPEWNLRADVVGRAMRLIADGVVDREGVAGLATRLHYSERHLHRQLVEEVGAGPKALARAQRARSARTLIESTDLPFSSIAFAAGFQSIRQFNDTIRAVFALTPTELRRRRSAPRNGDGIVLRLPFRAPLDSTRLFGFLSHRAIEGVEWGDETVYRRCLRLPHGWGIVELTPNEDHISCRIDLDDMRDLSAATARCRALLDLDADPVMIGDDLRRDPVIGKLVRSRPGMRLPGTVDAFELAVRAVVGQQISTTAARTLMSRIADAYGKPVSRPDDVIRLAFPDADTLADADLTGLGLNARRIDTIRSLAGAVASGDIDLDAGADRLDVHAKLQELPGIGPWTASYIAMRALGDPDAFLPTDLGVRKALEALGAPTDTRSVEAMAESWRPWRAYAVVYLWSTL